MSILYKVGDTVTIKPKSWFDKNKELIEIDSNIQAGVKHFLHLCESYFGRETKISERIIENNGYLLEIDNGRFVWPEEFFE